MVKLYYTIGLPGAGKNYYRETHLPDTVHISSDDLREEIFGDVNDQSHNDVIFNTMFERTVEHLNKGESCYYNACNINQKKRIKFLNSLRYRVKVEFETIALVFAIPFETCVERNFNRDRQVAKYIIERMYKSFQVPAYCEGWSDIQFIHDGENCIDLDAQLKELMTISHDNPHHRLTIGAHMAEARKYAVVNNFPTTVIIAAGIHDIGKKETKVFTNARGTPTKDAHYYGHESVGAYNFITSVSANYNTIWIANLIQLHMIFFQDENRIKNIRNLYGDEFFEELEQLHEADRAAH